MRRKRSVLWRPRLDDCEPQLDARLVGVLSPARCRRITATPLSLSLSQQQQQQATECAISASSRDNRSRTDVDRTTTNAPSGMVMSGSSVCVHHEATVWTLQMLRIGGRRIVD